MYKPLTSLFCLLIFSISLRGETLNSFSYAVGESKSNYFDPESSGVASVIRPLSRRLDYSRQIGEDWLASVSFEKVKGDGQWFSGFLRVNSFYNKASSRSHTWQASLVWFDDDIDWSVSFAKLRTQDESLFFLPEIKEKLTRNDQLFNFSVGKTLEFNDEFSNSLWTLDWSVGTQFAALDVHLIDQVELSTPIEVDAYFKQQSWTGFVDFSLNYWQVESSVIWGPYLILSWNSELQLSGDLSVTLSNEQRNISLDEAGSRYSQAFRTPDSGRWEMGWQFLFDSGFSFNFSYAKDVATASDFDFIEAVVGFSF
ncbi:MAG: hypothetical protein Q9M92_08630 [Enterobacterales bacterium]|nr:hypothetical protein [Enterobacterales bacterium]